MRPPVIVIPSPSFVGRNKQRALRRILGESTSAGFAAFNTAQCALLIVPYEVFITSLVPLVHLVGWKSEASSTEIGPGS